MGSCLRWLLITFRLWCLWVFGLICVSCWVYGAAGLGFRLMVSFWRMVGHFGFGFHFCLASSGCLFADALWLLCYDAV